MLVLFFTTLHTCIGRFKQDTAVHKPPIASTTAQYKRMFFGTCVALFIISLPVTVRFVGNISDSDIHYQESFSRPEARYPVGMCAQTPKYNMSTAVETDLPVLNLDILFVGREREAAEISSFLRSDTVYVIGIHGPPAFGKSTLAIHVGWVVVKAGILVRYVDVSERKLFRQSSKLNQCSGSASTATVESPAGHLQRYSEGWRSKDSVCEGGNTFCSELIQWAGTIDMYKHVLILDNCDGVLTGAQKDRFYQMINVLFQKLGYRHLSVVVTSQTKVSFVKQRTEQYYVSALSKQASLQLLLSSAPEWHITQEDGETIADLVGNCPLALQILCVAIRQSSNVTAVISMLKQNTLKTILPKHLGAEDRFEMVMNLAYTNLPDETKDCVQCVGAFPGSFDEDAGVIILEICELGGQDCLETLESRSLIGTEYRYRLHRLIREYFRLHISECSELKLFISSYREHYVSIFLELLYNTAQNVDILEHKLDVEYRCLVQSSR